MIKAKCISKNRDSKGVIVNYTLQDQNGQKMNVTGQQIKAAITAGQIDIINLQIDKAGRLVDKSVEMCSAHNKNSIESIEKQAETFIKFIQEAKRELKTECFDLHFDVKNEDAKKQILNECTKRYPNKTFTCNHKELVQKYTYGSGISGVDWGTVRSIESEVYLNELFANFIFGNLRQVEIQIADDWYSRHEYDLVIGGECTLEEVRELEAEENEYWNRISREVQKLVEKYRNIYGMILDYKLEDGYIEINGVSFK